MGVILDSSTVIAAERRGDSPRAFVSQVIASIEDQSAALSAVGLTEIVHGIYRADSMKRRLRRQQFLDELLTGLAVHPYTSQTALLAGKIDGEQRALGIVIPFSDLLIGATALSLGYAVLTTNVRHFRLIPGLTVFSA
jgi:tRNA(fMet)-specific endonuclease VapC